MADGLWEDIARFVLANKGLVAILATLPLVVAAAAAWLDLLGQKRRLAAERDRTPDLENKGLTGRELAAVRLAAGGLSSSEAAQELGVQPSTVRALLQRAYPKLGVSGLDGLRELMEGEAQKTMGDHVAEKRRARCTMYLMSQGLSELEAKVMLLTAQGMGRAAIAERLSYSISAVSAARAAGYRLLGARDRAGLRAALEQGHVGVRPRPTHTARRLALPVAFSLVAAFGVAVCVLAWPGGAVYVAPGLVPVSYGDGLVGYAYASDLKDAEGAGVSSPEEASALMEARRKRLATCFAGELNARDATRLYTDGDAQDLIDEGWTEAAGYYVASGIEGLDACKAGGKAVNLTFAQIEEAYEAACFDAGKKAVVYDALGVTVVGVKAVGYSAP